MSHLQSQAEETRWIAQARGGDGAVFAHLVERYQRAVYNLCYRLLGDEMAAEDAAQEVFVRAYFKLASYDERRKFSTWLYAIASHYCLDQLERRRLRLMPWEDGFDQRLASERSDTLPERALIEEETTREVQRLVAWLRPAYRAPVILKYWYGMSCQEIALSLDTTTGAVKSKLFRARRAMAQAAAKSTASCDSLMTIGTGRYDPLALTI